MVLQAANDIGLRGKSILEIGGALPRGLVIDRLGAQQWVGVEKQDFYSEIGVRRTDTQIVSSLHQVGDTDYAVLDDYIENIDDRVTDRFDAIVSFAAFEHIARFPAALAKMFQVLKPGGKLFSMYSPIWSAHDGHHLHEVTDKAGNLFHFGNSPIPPFGHLLMSPPQLYQYLLAKTDSQAAAKIVYNVYNSQLINRLFIEDYFHFFHLSDFSVEQFYCTAKIDIPEETQEMLAKAYPGRRHFEFNGVKVILSKDGKGQPIPATSP